jgi:hypothetical protein
LFLAVTSVAEADDLDDIIQDVITKTSEEERTGLKKYNADDLYLIPDEHAIRCHGCAAIMNHDAISTWLISGSNGRPSPRKDARDLAKLTADRRELLSSNVPGKTCHVCRDAATNKASKRFANKERGASCGGQPAKQRSTTKRQLATPKSEKFMVVSNMTPKTR